MMDGSARIRAGRGYTLVEMGITVVVIGLLLGGLLMPLGQRLRSEQYEQVRSDLVVIRQAVVAYATASSAPGFHWVHWNGAGTVYSKGRLPAGRKYLPCPDVDGDGAEDRIGNISGSDLDDPSKAQTEAFFSNLGEFSPDSAAVAESQIATVPVTMTIGGVATVIDMIVRQPVSSVTIGTGNLLRAHLGTATSRREVLSFVDDMSPNQLDLGHARSYGHCVSDTGAVPWSTLGTPPSDPWGNRYVYRVDPYFAHSLLGFGPESRADAFDPTRALVDPTSNTIPSLKLYGAQASVDQQVSHTIDNLYEYRKRDAVSDTYSTSTGAGSIVSSKYPGLICLDGSTDCEWSDVAALTGDISTKYIGEVAMGARDMVIWDNFGGIQAQREYNAGDPIDGMAFVVLSTGENRAGGIPSTGGRVASVSGDGFIRCLSSVPRTDHEKLNVPANVCNVPSPPADAGENSYNFSQLPIAGRGSFDDELVYMSGRELVGRLAANGVDLGPIWIPPGKRI